MPAGIRRLQQGFDEWTSLTADQAFFAPFWSACC
jgi:hypothetical protein